MSISRRQVLKLGSISILPLAGGCSSLSTSTETPTQTVQPPIIARLVGPNTDQVLFRQNAVVTAGSVREYNEQFSVPVTLSDEAATDIVGLFNSVDITENRGEFKVILSERNQDITRFGISLGLTREISDGDWSGGLLLQFDQQATADAVRRRLI